MSVPNVKVKGDIKYFVEKLEALTIGQEELFSLLDEIKVNQEEIIEKLDNLSRPGSDYGVYAE